MRIKLLPLIALLALFLSVGGPGPLLAVPVAAEEAPATEKPPGWWQVPKLKTGEEEETRQPSALERWFPQIFAPPEPGAPEPNFLVRTWRWVTGFFKKKQPENLPPGWKRPLQDPSEIEPTPVPTPPVPAGEARFDPQAGILTVTGISITKTKPEPARPASHARASKAAREFTISEIASWPTSRGVALGEMMTSEDVDAMRDQMEEIFAGKQLNGTWVATVRLNVRKFPMIVKYCPGLFAGSTPWTRVLTKPNI